MAGWIKLHRKLQRSKVWTSEPFSRGQAWVDLLLSANHSEGVIFVRGVPVIIQRGQVGTSEVALAARWSWSRGKVRRFLKWLKTEQQIEHQTTNVTSVLTITNYDEHQGDDTADGTASSTADGQQTDSRRYWNKKEENEKNEKKGKKKRASPFIPPSVEEVKAHCRKNKIHIDAAAFWAHHENNDWKLKNGRKMKDWRLAITTWASNEKRWGRRKESASPETPLLE